MYAQVAKPKLSLKITTAVTNSASLSLKSPVSSIPLSPAPPAAASPRSAKLPTFSYTNNCTSAKSILKKPQSVSYGANTRKRIQFKGEPIVHPITPIENPEDYYGSHTKMSRDERRWSQLSDL